MLVDYSTSATCEVPKECLTNRATELDSVPFGDIHLDLPTYGHAVLQNAVNAFVNDLVQDRDEIQNALEKTGETVCTVWEGMATVDSVLAITFRTIQEALD
ncbi:MAG: hypothetical protein LBR58_09985 [Propionibacteriaceae bacterium]|jgi:hypothetical protein|nr:hypothetical protein [Propionibacteriaceae bacterium]